MFEKRCVCVRKRRVCVCSLLGYNLNDLRPVCIFCVAVWRYVSREGAFGPNAAWTAPRAALIGSWLWITCKVQILTAEFKHQKWNFSLCKLQTAEASPTGWTCFLGLMEQMRCKKRRRVMMGGCCGVSYCLFFLFMRMTCENVAVL